MNVTLFARWSSKMRSQGWVIVQYDGFIIKTGNLDAETEIQGEHHVKIGVLLPQANESQRFPAKPEDRREAWNRFSFTSLEAINPANTLILAV